MNTHDLLTILLWLFLFDFWLFFFDFSFWLFFVDVWYVFTTFFAKINLCWWKWFKFIFCTVLMYMVHVLHLTFWLFYFDHFSLIIFLSAFDNFSLIFAIWLFFCDFWYVLPLSSQTITCLSYFVQCWCIWCLFCT